MSQHGLSLSDLRAGGRATTRGPKPSGQAAAQYRNPATRETWSGRRRPPKCRNAWRATGQQPAECAT